MHLQHVLAVYLEFLVANRLAVNAIMDWSKSVNIENRSCTVLQELPYYEKYDIVFLFELLRKLRCTDLLIDDNVFSVLNVEEMDLLVVSAR